MSVRQKTLQALALAGVIAMGLFLAGCGGGGGSSSSNMMGGDMGGDDMGGDMGGDDMDDETPMTTRNDLNLFMQANGMDQTFTAIEDDPTTMDMDESMTVEQQRMAEAMAFGAELAEAAKEGQGRPLRVAVGSNAPRQPIEPGIMVMWAAEDDTSTNTGAMPDESELRIEIDPDVPNQFDADNLVTNQITSNYRTIDGLDDVFMHGFEIWRGGDDPADQAQAIVFTDKQQGTPAVDAVDAISAGTLGNRAVTPVNVVMFTSSDVSQGGNTIMNVTYFEDSTEAMDPDYAYMGTLTCSAGASCSYTMASDGTISSITGYTFTGSRMARAVVEAVDAMENNDYLVFGLWLYETSADATPPDGVESFGAFADGGRLYPEDLALFTLTGRMTYTGKAFGAHHMGGMTSWFDADASITIDWDVSAPGAWATAMGEISNIQIAGGEMLADSIYLNIDMNGNGADGTALMGAESRPGAGDYPFSGGSSIALYGVEGAGNFPDGVAGTFGVTNMDETETFVGAYGARMETP